MRRTVLIGCLLSLIALPACSSSEQVLSPPADVPEEYVKIWEISQKRLKKSPQDVSTLNQLGVATWRHLRDRELALNYFQRALESQPDSAQTYFNIGVMELSQEHLGVAEFAFLTALESRIIRNDLEMRSFLYINLGKVYELQGDLEKAREKYLVARELRPYDPYSYLNLGQLYFAQDDFDNAIAELDEFLHHSQPIEETGVPVGQIYEVRRLLEELRQIKTDL